MNAECVGFSWRRHHYRSSAGAHSTIKNPPSSPLVKEGNEHQHFPSRLTSPGAFTSLKGCGSDVPILQCGPTILEPR